MTYIDKLAPWMLVLALLAILVWQMDRQNTLVSQATSNQLIGEFKDSTESMRRQIEALDRLLRPFESVTEKP